MVYGEAGRPTRVLSHLYLEGLSHPKPVAGSWRCWGLPQVSGRDGAQTRVDSPEEGLVEALTGDSEGEDRGQAMVRCPRFAVLDVPAGCTHAALQAEAWAVLVGLPGHIMCQPVRGSGGLAGWGALLVLGRWSGPHQMIW